MTIFRLPVLNQIVKTLAPAVVVLLVHIFRVFVFPLAYEWDQLMHFTGGASMAWVAWSSMGYLIKEKTLPALPGWFRGLTSWSFAGLIGLLWELQEYALFIWWIPSMDIRLPDTELDMLLDVSGAALLLIVLLVVERAQTKKRV